MLESILSYYEGRTALQVGRDILDILVVYYVFYRLLLVARGTRAIQIAAGLGIISLLYVVAQVFELVAITTLVGALLQSIILVIVVVFQNDIRRALQRVGSRAFLGGTRAHETEVIEQVVEAARELARHRIGAIIAFEQDADLREFVGQNKGIDLDAEVSAELLVSLFVPESVNKLHDGAVVLRDLRVAKAGVFFPMPENRDLESSFGSRHRAALGITEETDAIVVVVSEERGTISFCFNGNIAPNLQANQLREMLFSIMSPKSSQASSRESRAPQSSKARVSVLGHDTDPGLDAAPASARPVTPSPPHLGDGGTPLPLRKSTQLRPAVESPRDDESVRLPAVRPRPMPKAGKSDSSPDQEEASDKDA